MSETPVLGVLNLPYWEEIKQARMIFPVLRWRPSSLVRAGVLSAKSYSYSGLKMMSLHQKCLLSAIQHEPVNTSLHRKEVTLKSMQSNRGNLPVYTKEIMAQHFRNILEDLKKNANDFLWISRTINFIKAYNQNRPNMSPDLLKTMVADSSRLHNKLTEAYNLNHRNMPPDQLIKTMVADSSNLYNKLTEIYDDKFHLPTKKQVVDILEEIGYEYDLAVIRWLGLFLVKIIRKCLTGLYVNESKLSMIASKMGSSPVIFVPTHRSYGDFILMAFICFKYNIHIPCVAAGMDFLSMQCMSKVLRKSKAFFMRRKFLDDPLYCSVFQEYIQAMVSFEESPIEFFIEGTRSRTGKSLPPKFGLLTMLAEAYLSGDVPDLTIVPINISYDRVLEETLFAYELLGIPKPKESTKGFLKALKVLNENYGNVYINFGDPFSIRLFFDNEVDSRYRSPDKESNKIKQTAYKISKMQQSLQIYGCFNLLALALYNNMIGTNCSTLSLRDALRNVNDLLFLFQMYGADVHIDGDLEPSIRQCITVHSSVVNLSSDNMLTLRKLKHKLEINKNKNIKGCNLDDRIIKEGVPHIMLQIYVNPSLTLFIRSSIILTLINCLSKETKITLDLLYQNYRYVCDIFKNEFVMNSSDFKEYHYSVMKLVSLGIIELNGDIISLALCNNIFHFFLNLLKPFLISANEFCTFLLEKNIGVENHQQIINGAQNYISIKILSGDVQHYYCLSLDVLSNVCNSLIDMKVIVREKRKNKLFVDRELLNDLTYYLNCLVNGKIQPHGVNINSFLCINNLKSKL